MKKKRVLFFTRILYIIFTIGTIVSLFIIYKDFDSRIAYNFVLGYVFLAFFMILYIPLTSFIDVIFLKDKKEKDIR